MQEDMFYYQDYRLNKLKVQYESKVKSNKTVKIWWVDHLAIESRSHWAWLLGDRMSFADVNGYDIHRDAEELCWMRASEALGMYILGCVADGILRSHTPKAGGVGTYFTRIRR